MMVGIGSLRGTLRLGGSERDAAECDLEREIALGIHGVSGLRVDARNHIVVKSSLHQ